MLVSSGPIGVPCGLFFSVYRVMTMSEQNWDHSVDVLVVGSGAGGMLGAVRAADLGADTLLIEKSNRYGGSTAMSGGVIWIINNHLMPITGAGVQDSDEEGLAYLKHLTQGKVPEARLQAYVRYGREMVQWTMENTRTQFQALDIYPDYYPAVEGYKHGSRSIEPKAFDGRLLGEEFENLRDPHVQLLIFGRLMMTTYEVRGVFKQEPGWILQMLKSLGNYLADFQYRLKSKRSRRLTFGNGLVGSLRLSMLDRGIPLWLNTPLQELIVEEGRVVGAVVEKDGVPFRIQARKGVLLAAGGFESNQAMREQYLPGPTKAEWTAANPANTGDAINAGIRIGAGTGFMDDAWWGPTCIPPGEPTARMLVIEKSLPGCLFVAPDGKRFTDEAAAYIEIVNDMHKAQREGRDVLPAWMIFGKHYRQKYPMGPVLPAGSGMPDAFVPKHLWDNFIYKADTVEALAQKIGVNAEGLMESIARMNRFAETGVDADFGKGGNEYDRYYGDDKVTPNPCLAPVEAPYYAVRIYPGDLGTKGGLQADDKARVLTEDGQVIPGLYAVGNCSAAVMGPTYAGAGSTIGPAMAFAYIAANDMLSPENAS